MLRLPKAYVPKKIEGDRESGRFWLLGDWHPAFKDAAH